LPSVNPRAAEIIKTITDFEASVAEADAALAARDWPRIDALLARQHRLTHGLANLLEETAAERPPSFTDEVFRRIKRIFDQRDDQLRRLVAFNHLVKERLVIVSRSRELYRVTQGEKRPRLLDTRL